MNHITVEDFWDQLVADGGERPPGVLRDIPRVEDLVAEADTPRTASKEEGRMAKVTPKDWFDIQPEIAEEMAERGWRTMIKVVDRDPDTITIVPARKRAWCPELEAKISDSADALQYALKAKLGKFAEQLEHQILQRPPPPENPEVPIYPDFSKDKHVIASAPCTHINESLWACRGCKRVNKCKGR